MAFYENEEDAFLPLRDVVFKQLREEILYGKLKPGERLMEVALSERLGVSRTPIREGIRLLEKEGLVVMLPRRGAHVASITAKQLADVLEARRTLETFTMNACCARITRTRYEELKKANERFAEAIDGGNLRDMADTDTEFHNIIIDTAGNEKVKEMLVNLKEQIFRYKYEFMKEMSDPTRLVREHDQIIKAIGESRSDRAVELIKLHIDSQAIAIYRNIK
ncbi:MAG TPA: GntR family transcriptional regulator [Lachnospiraceae bacterium]|nr:GntR family transcriptional regulator [Lachnospiraceae bacterium]MBQ2454052.1 GntR family transcriptional regulator [Lachnospiraceae bacterium]MBQ4241639.1 GntR family transcriptional regulator [Lachnospiraceae bacterium]MBQ9566511.1 GntR family transcriptional regulator [Lachnospiraceae bacterium]MCR4786041.1 GntR family transcriptional regulator [Lachnospiraceae bacterium]